MSNTPRLTEAQRTTLEHELAALPPHCAVVPTDSILHDCDHCQKYRALTAALAVDAAYGETLAENVRLFEELLATSNRIVNDPLRDRELSDLKAKLQHAEEQYRRDVIDLAAMTQELDELRDAVMPNWREKGCEHAVIVGNALCHRDDHETMNDLDNDEEFRPQLREKLNALAALRKRVQALETAGQALVDALAACRPGLDSLAVIAHVHGMRYSGPTYGVERDALAALLRAPDTEPTK